MTVLSYEILEPPVGVPGRSWRTAMLEDSLLATGRFASVIKVAFPKSRVFHVVMRSSGQPVALSCVTLLPVRLGPIRVELAVCGNPMISSDSAIFTASDVNREELLPSALQTLNAALDNEGIPLVLLREIVADDETLAPSGYWRLPIQPVLGIATDRWNSFEEYLDDMKSHYRGLVRRAFRELGQEEIVVQKEADVRPIARRLYELYRIVASESTTQDRLYADPPTWADKLASYLTNMPRRHLRAVHQDFFVALKETFPQDTDIVTLRRGEAIIGCTLNLHDRTVLHSIYMGMQRDRDTPFLYRALLAAKMQRAIERRVRLVHFGRICLVTKADFGATALPEALCCRLGPAALNTGLAFIARLVQRGQTPFVPRSVFKDTHRAA